eukprot:jgi/Botrbrau1/22449/Bobra.0091s0051.1
MIRTRRALHLRHGIEESAAILEMQSWGGRLILVEFNLGQHSKGNKLRIKLWVHALSKWRRRPHRPTPRFVYIMPSDKLQAPLRGTRRMFTNNPEGVTRRACMLHMCSALA